jgi:hypothetical protein
MSVEDTPAELPVDGGADFDGAAEGVEVGADCVAGDEVVDAPSFAADEDWTVYPEGVGM